MQNICRSVLHTRQNSKAPLKVKHVPLSSPNLFNLMKAVPHSFPDQWEVNFRLIAQPSTNEQKLSSLTTSHSWIQQHIFSDIKSFHSLHCFAVAALIDRVTHMSIVKIWCVHLCVCESPFPLRRSLFIPSHWFIDPLIFLLKANDVSKWLFQFARGRTLEACRLHSKDNST